MRDGEFEDGAHVLRAKIDMSSPNFNMRDPTLYRIRKVFHHRTKDKWCIYPMYDFAHCLSDSIEKITHSICTLEFENNRPLYDWILDALEVDCHPQQIEFARLNLTYTVLSKRKLIMLVNQGMVEGWDDPRMPTISGMRRRGFTPESIRNLCARAGVSKKESYVDIAFLEHCVREDLNKRAKRVMGVLRPLKLVIENYPNDLVEELEAINNPEDPSMGVRHIPFSKELYIEQEDFMENPPKQFFRLSPGREVRLRYAYFIKCTDVIKNPDTGEILEIRCIYDPETRGGYAPDGRKVKSTLHWVSARNSIPAMVRLYKNLFTKEMPDEEADGLDFTHFINPDSCEILTSCRLEPGLQTAKPGSYYQFERLGYFCIDSILSKPEALIFNRTVTLKDEWEKIKKQAS
jgi:glutaminyl-tRNA synthetase